ncbi:hypothetical protein TNCT1_05900 [Streptomyces sp. 1-11]|nr:hypothetical protein TNCT1_05900 [Streptomyces sp. 1-11]
METGRGLMDAGPGLTAAGRGLTDAGPGLDGTGCTGLTGARLEPDGHRPGGGRGEGPRRLEPRGPLPVATGFEARRCPGAAPGVAPPALWDSGSGPGFRRPAPGVPGAGRSLG